MKPKAKKNSTNINPEESFEQLEFFSKKESQEFASLTHGGDRRKAKRKTKRPLFDNKVTHVVLKSSKAKWHLSFYKNKKQVIILLKERSKKYFIEILDFVNMGNHLLLKVRFKDKNRFKNFLRRFTPLLARKNYFCKKKEKPLESSGFTIKDKFPAPALSFQSLSLIELVTNEAK